MSRAWSPTSRWAAASPAARLLLSALCLLVAACSAPTSSVSPAEAPGRGPLSTPPSAGESVAASGEAVDAGSLLVRQELQYVPVEGEITTVLVEAANGATPLKERVLAEVDVVQDLLTASLAPGTYQVRVQRRACNEEGCPDLESAEATSFNPDYLQCIAQVEIVAGSQTEVLTRPGTLDATTGTAGCTVDVRGPT